MIIEAPRLSVIIPTLNEAARLPGLLAALRSQRGVRLELIVADGGSQDDTGRLARLAGVTLVETSRGRGRQMNGAARQATADFLLFLHADSVVDDPELLARGLQALREAEGREADRAPVAGHFRLGFLRNAPGHGMAYRYLEEKTAFNRPNTTNGDQGFLLRREFFWKLGGFDEDLPFLEDQKLAEKIRQHGRWITLPGRLMTSARRFEVEGLHRRYILMAITMGLFCTGVDSFFARTPDLYRSQADTGRLRLWPYFVVIWRMMRRDLGLLGSLAAWFRVGGYIRKNSWQMFYFFDIACRPWLGRKRYPFLIFHDKVLAPLLGFAVCDVVTGGLAFVWFMLLLGPWFYLTDRATGN